MLVSKVDSGERLAVPHERLGGQVKDAVDLVLGQCPLDQPVVADVPVHDVDRAFEAQQRQRRVRRRVTSDAHTRAPASSSR